MRAATLKERQAFLLALFGNNEMHHGSYISEKVKVALNEHTSPDLLYSALDASNQSLYTYILENLNVIYT